MNKITGFNHAPLIDKGLMWGFSRAGFDTSILDTPRTYYNGLDVNECYNEIYKQMVVHKPDYVVFEGYHPIVPLALKEACNKLGVGFIYWSIEDPVLVKDSMFIARVADVVFTTTEECLELYKANHITAHLLTFACNPDYHKIGSYNQVYDLDLAIQASYYIWPARKRGYESILKPILDRDIKIWGAYWDTEDGRNFLKENVYKFCGYLPNDKLPDLCASAKIILGVQCDDSSMTQTSMRPYEVLGCGGFHLTQWTKATQNIFGPSCKHLVMSSSPEETLYMINYYLDKPEERNKIAKAGQEFVYKYHTYERRVLEDILPYL